MTKMRLKRDSEAACHRELLVSICCMVEAREKRKDRATNAFEKLRKVYENERKVRGEAHVAKCGEFRERLAPLMNDLEIRIKELQITPGLASEAALLRQAFSEARKEADDQHAKLAASGQVVKSVSEIKEEVSKLLLSLT